MERIYRYRTIRNAASSRLLIRGSKFHGYAEHVSDRAAIDATLQTIQSEHPKARHICFAWRLVNAEGTTEEYATDAGEPSGSAGLPILGAMKSHELFNTICVVVRYFGGTKLGIPGLIDAYGSAAREAIEGANTGHETLRKTIGISLPMKYQPMLYESVKKRNIEITGLEYTERIRAEIQVDLENWEQTLTELFHDLSGRDYDSREEYLEFLEAEINL